MAARPCAIALLSAPASWSLAQDKTPAAGSELAEVSLRKSVQTKSYQGKQVDAGESFTVIRARVNQARKIQLQRFDKSKIHANAQMGAKEIKRYCAVKNDANKLLETAINKLGLSERA